MKRHPYLQPLSREHHPGLVISNKAMQANEADYMMHWQALIDYLTIQIPTHFEVEKTYIADVILAKLNEDEVKMLATEMLKQHDDIEALMGIKQPGVSDVQALARALYDHIRFEEREVFAKAQTVLSEAELKVIYDASDDRVKRYAKNR